MGNTFIKELYEQYLESTSCPPPKEVITFFHKVLQLLYPELSDHQYENYEAFEDNYNSLTEDLKVILDKNGCDNIDKQSVLERFKESLPNIKNLLQEDVLALFNGDPAAKSTTEVIRTYPGFYAIAAHRIANRLHHLGLSLIPRIISENAHGNTGIDIHPGATIGKRFCIDHGTGVVIGETTHIGDNVKIYQGVTLGALSVRKEDAKTKRHPTIEDNVVIYSGATILGGKTVVGSNSIIGGNVWITESIPKNSRLTYIESQKRNQQIEPL